MKLALAVYGAPQSSQASTTALRFARAATTAGHEVVRVFFYHDGVNVGNGSAVPPQDEGHPASEWVTLAEACGFELAICIASALKRGIVDADEQRRYTTPAATLGSGFSIVGLGQWIDAIIEADRLVTFAA